MSSLQGLTSPFMWDASFSISRTEKWWFSRAVPAGDWDVCGLVAPLFPCSNRTVCSPEDRGMHPLQLGQNTKLEARPFSP